MKIKIFILLILVLTSVNIYSQKKDFQSQKTDLYSDFVADEKGNRLADIVVRVQSTGKSTRTDFNGRFSIEASIGDVIELSKNGVIINTYVYDGSTEYRVEDETQLFNSKVKKSTGENKFTAQLNLAKQYVKTNPFKSIEYVEAALKSQTSKRRNSSNISQAYEVLGDVYTNLKQHDLAIDNYTISVENGASNIVKLKLAKAYTSFKNYTKSNRVLSTILNRKISSLDKIGVYETLGDNYLNLNNYKQAEQNYSKALELANSNKFIQKVSNLNSKLATVSSFLGQTTKAKNYLDSAISVSKKQSINKRAITNNSVANQYRDQQNFDKEIELKKQTLQELKEANLDEIIVDDAEENISVQQLNLDIGNAYAKKKSFPTAIDYLEKSKGEADKASDIETKKEAVQQLSEIYKNVGDYKKALSNYQEYVALVDVLYKKKEKEIEAAVELSKNLAEKQNRINSLEKDRELTESKYKLYETEQQVTVENYKRQRLIIYSLVGGLLLLLAAIYFMYKSNKQRKLANNLLALKSFRSQMNPHFIFNALNSVNSFIAQNDERSANRYLTEFSTLMRNVLNNSEEDFIPLSKEIELLELYMKLEHARFKDKFDYSISIDKNLNIKEYQIPPMLLQPYVENAVWHGLRYKEEKGFLKVSFISKDDESILIEISDNGIGRTKSKELKTANQQKQQSKGMDNIKKRVAILNEMYSDKVDVFIEDLYSDTSGTKVILTLKKE